MAGSPQRDKSAITELVTWLQRPKWAYHLTFKITCIMSYSSIGLYLSLLRKPSVCYLIYWFLEMTINKSKLFTWVTGLPYKQVYMYMYNLLNFLYAKFSRIDDNNYYNALGKCNLHSFKATWLYYSWFLIYWYWWKAFL